MFDATIILNTIWVRDRIDETGKFKDTEVGEWRAKKTENRKDYIVSEKF